MTTRNILTAFACAALACGCAQAPKDCVVEGACPAISRDGRFLAFQRQEGLRFHLGILDLKTSEITWVARGETDATRRENAFQPAWGPDNALVFAYANITNTAYQRFERPDGNDTREHRLRLRTKDGKVRDLVEGCARNYNPSFSPDGRQVYFCKQGGVGKSTKHDFAIRKALAVVDVDAPEDVRPVVPYPCDGDSALSQPVVSPDGRFLAYAELPNSFTRWGIKVCDLANPCRQMSLTPGTQSGYAPNWFPDSRHIVYTGFSEGDPGWCVYVQDIASGALKRVAIGEDACVSPDGKTIYYSRDGKVYRQVLTAADFPVAIAKVADPTAVSEQVIWKWDLSTTNRISKTGAAPHACATDLPHFVRYTVDWPGRKGRDFITAAGFEGQGSVWTFLLGEEGDRVVALAREADGTCTAAEACTPLSPGKHRFTIVRVGETVYNSVDGSQPSARRAHMPDGLCDGKVAFSAFPNNPKDDVIRVSDIEAGIGWPTNVPAPLTIGK